jgi:hypothetical protein
MQICCFFTSVILEGQYNSKTALTHKKNVKKKNKRPHSTMVLGRMVHKGYSLQYLAIHNCTISSFLTAFKFWGILGSTFHSRVLWKTSKADKRIQMGQLCAIGHQFSIPSVQSKLLTESRKQIIIKQNNKTSKLNTTIQYVLSDSL